MSVRIGLNELRRRGYHLDARCFRWLRRLYQGSHMAVPGDAACAAWLQRLWGQFPRPSATYMKLLVDVAAVVPAHEAGAWLSGTPSPIVLYYIIEQSSILLCGAWVFVSRTYRSLPTQM